MKQSVIATVLFSMGLLSACNDGSKAPADDGSFVIEGQIPLPDGYNVGLCVHTDTAYAVAIAEAVMKDGRFELTGKTDKTYQGTLMTNNLSLVEQNQWPVDSIHWTYTDVFLSSGHLQFTGTEESNFRLTGTDVQADYNELLSMGGAEQADKWAFIDNHPQSVVSTWLACQMTDRAYRLTADQVNHLAETIKDCPADTSRFALLQRKLASARQTVKNGPLADLELVSVKGDTCHLTDVVKQVAKSKSEKGQQPYVLIDFWASWCGICLYSMPAVQELVKQQAGRLSVVAVSIDTKEEAWRTAMEKHPEPWPQYMTTKQGYDDLFTKYQVGNGVPYYLLISPEGLVIGSPERPEDTSAMMQ